MRALRWFVALTLLLSLSAVHFSDIGAASEAPLTDVEQLENMRGSPPVGDDATLMLNSSFETEAYIVVAVVLLVLVVVLALVINSIPNKGGT